eukprot:g9351.t1
MLRRKEQSTAELNGRVAKLDGRLQELRKAISALAVAAPGVTAATGLPQRGFQKTGRGTSALAAKRRSLSPIVLQVPVMSPVFAGSASPRRVSNLDARYLNFNPPNQNAAAPLHTVVSIPASEVVVQSAAGPPGEQETAAESGGHDKFVLRPQLSLLSQVRGQGSGGARSLSAFGYSFAPGGK